MAYLLINGNRLVVGGNPLRITEATIPKIVVAKQTISFASAGINSSNTHVIYEVSAALKSYTPGRLINAITGFEIQKGYYWVTKDDTELPAYVVPPL